MKLKNKGGTMKYSSVKKALSATLAILMCCFNTTVYAAPSPQPSDPPKLAELNIQISYVTDDDVDDAEKNELKTLGLNSLASAYVEEFGNLSRLNYDALNDREYGLKVISDGTVSEPTDGDELLWDKAKHFLPYADIKNQDKTGIYIDFNRLFGNVYKGYDGDIEFEVIPNENQSAEIASVEYNEDHTFNIIERLKSTITLNVPEDSDVIWDYDTNREGKKSQFHFTYTLDTPEPNDELEDKGWKFKGWRVKNSKDFITTLDTSNYPSDDENITEIQLEGVWSKKDDDAATYEASLNYTTDVDGKDLPQAIKDVVNTFNEQNAKVLEGTELTVDYKIGSPVDDETNDGHWELKEQTATGTTLNETETNTKLTVGKENVVVTGKWDFVPNPRTVTYSYVAKDGSPELPQDLMDELKPLNDDPNEKHKDKVSVYANDRKANKTFTDDKNNGVWTLETVVAKEAKENGADLPIDAEDKVTLGSEDIKVEGTWSFKSNRKASLNYTTDVVGKDLPKAIKDVVKTFNEQNAKVLEGTELTVDYKIGKTVEDKANDGHWELKEQTATGATLNETETNTKLTVGKENVVVTGKWDFVPNPRTVTYSYVAKDGSPVELPDKLKEELNSLNNDPKEKHKDDKVSVYANDRKTNKTFDDTKNDGVWTLETVVAKDKRS